MARNQVTGVVVEVLEDSPPPNARITGIVVEVLATTDDVTGPATDPDPIVIINT